MPFNRAEREWVNKSSRAIDNTMAFGSTKNLTPPGTPLFINCPFPTLDEHAGTPGVDLSGDVSGPGDPGSGSGGPCSRARGASGCRAHRCQDSQSLRFRPDPSAGSPGPVDAALADSNGKQWG